MTQTGYGCAKCLGDHKASECKLGKAESPMTQDAIRLLPCPFCGGEAELLTGMHAFNDVIIRCKKCSTESALFDGEHENLQVNTDDALEAWNTRAHSREDEVQALRQMNKAAEALLWQVVMKFGHYYNNYMLDEAADVSNCVCGQEQHESAEKAGELLSAIRDYLSTKDTRQALTPAKEK